jgi:hypothetical protein
MDDEEDIDHEVRAAGRGPGTEPVGRRMRCWRPTDTRGYVHRPAVQQLRLGNDGGGSVIMELPVRRP